MKTYNRFSISFRSFCISFLCLFLVSTAHGQWTQVDGLYGGEVLSLAVSGSTYFAGTNSGGVFRSTMNNGKWTVAGLATHQVNALAVNGTTIFAGTFDKGVFRSTDDGETWTTTGLKSQTVFSLAVSGTTIFAGTYSSGIYRSTDNGNVWTEVNMGLKNKTVYALAVNGTSLYAGTDGGGVFRSIDNAESWTEINTGLTRKTVKSFAFSGTTLFAGINNGGVFRTTDDGANWTDVGLMNTTVWSLAQIGSKIVAGTNNGGYTSIDNGGNWIKLDVAALPNKPVRALTVNGATLYAGIYGDRGLYRSADIGVNWTPVVLPNLTVAGFAEMIGTIFAGTQNGVFLSTDNGTNWSAAGTTTINVNTIAAQGTTLYAGSRDGGLYSSTDNGKSWTLLGLQNQFVTGITFFGSIISVSTSGGVFSSIDKGISWIDFNKGLTDRSIIAIADDDLSNFAMAIGDIFRQDEKDGSWSNVYKCPTDDYFVSLFGSGKYIYAGTEFSGLFLSTNNGNNWMPMGLKNQNIRAIVLNGKTLITGTFGGGIFISNDNGTTWSNQQGMANQNINALSVIGTTLLAGTNGTGVWRFDLSTLSTETDITPLNTKLSCYPNPAANSLTIDNSSPLYNSADPIHYTISTFTGEVLSEFEKDESRFTIPIETMSNGVYYLIARQGLVRTATKFTVIQ